MGAAKEQSAGNKAGGSRFAATCGLLRQYIKEQGCVPVAPAVTMSLMPGGGDGAAAAAEAPEERKTMLELFPQQAGTLKDSQERKPEKAQLTIFYGGRALVFDNFPAEKAKELMQLAGSCTPAAVTDAGAAAVYRSAEVKPCLSDLPIARKASLHRFLEKRKSRLAAADPYPVASASAGAAAKESGVSLKDDAASWLSVNADLSLS